MYDTLLRLDEKKGDGSMGAQSNEVQAQGTIRLCGTTTYRYGTHILVDLTGMTTYALQSTNVDLNTHVGKFATVGGGPIPGYPRDGGPPLLEVIGVDDAAVAPTDASQPIDVRINDSFTIFLPGHETGGYEWTIAQPLDEQIVTFLKSDYQPNTGLDTGGVAQFQFKAVGAGETRIALQEARSWEHAVPATSVTYTVRVS